MKAIILFEKLNGKIARLTLNRPERHNSLVPELLEQFLDGLRLVDGDHSLRVLILAAEGRSFSTGGDLSGFYNHIEELESYASHLVGLLNEAILGIMRMKIPVIAAVQGQVTGGSLGLVLAADIVLLTQSTSFRPYYPVVGFSPDGGWTAILPRLIGSKRTAEVLFTNRTISAEQAVQWGLANRVVAEDELENAVLEIAGTIASMKPGSVIRSKELLTVQVDEISALLGAEKERFVEQVSSQEAIQGLGEFLSKVGREPTK